MNIVAQKSKVSTRTLALVGMMVAITVILDYTIGVIPLPMVSATIVHIPTVIAGIVAGPVVGAVVGTCMGILSLIHSATRPPSPLSVLLINPLVSVLPRIFIGVMSYYGYKACTHILGKRKMGESISVFVGAAIGSMTNTIGVLSMMYFVYAQKIEMILQSTTAKAFVITVASTSGVAELLVSGIISVPIVVAIKKVYR